MPGFWYSTRQVGNTAARPWRRATRTLGRLWNQVVKRCRAKGGSIRTLETPVAFSKTFRRSEPGFAVAALATDAMREPSAPTRSVRAMALVVSWWRRPDLVLGVAGGRGPQHQAGEVDGPLALARDVRAVDVAALALEALVHDPVLLVPGQRGRALVVVSGRRARTGSGTRAEWEHSRQPVQTS